MSHASVASSGASACTSLLGRLRDLVDRGRVDVRDLRVSSLLAWLWPLARRDGQPSLGDLCGLLETAARLALLKARRITGEWTIRSDDDGPAWLGPPAELPVRRSWLAERILGGPYSFAAPARAFEGVAPSLAPVAPDVLSRAMARLLGRQAPPPAISAPARPRMSVEQASRMILVVLERGGEVSLAQVAGETPDARIAAFLACLTLVRQGRVSLDQEELFGEIRIRGATSALEATA